MARLSIGAKWALRYTVVSVVTISLLGMYVYSRAEGRLKRDAELITSAPLRNVVEFMKRNPGDVDALAEALDREISAADGDLRLGIQYFNSHGRVVLASGSLEQRPIPLPASVLEKRRSALFWEKTHADGRRYYVMTSAAPESALRLEPHRETQSKNDGRIDRRCSVKERSPSMTAPTKLRAAEGR